MTTQQPLPFYLNKDQMPPPERFKPYRRGISKQEIIAYLEESDESPICRDGLPKRALQMEAASQQRRLDAAMLRSHPARAINSPQLPQQLVMSASSPENSISDESFHNGISPALLEAVEYHGNQYVGNGKSPSSTRSSSDQESSPCPSQQNNQPLSADQIEFSGDEELIDLGSPGSPAPEDLVDSKRQSLYLSLFEGVDVFAAASVASDPPTPTLPPEISCLTEEAQNLKGDNINGKDFTADNINSDNINLGDRVKSSDAAFQQQSPVVERLDKLINLQTQLLCVNVVTLCILVSIDQKESFATSIPVTRI